MRHDIGERPGKEEVLAPARDARSPRPGSRRHDVGAQQRAAEQHEISPRCRRPRRRGRRRARSGRHEAQPHAVADRALPELQERVVGLGVAPPAPPSGGASALTAAVERRGARLRCRGCARWPSGRSSSPPTRPRSGSTRSARPRLRRRRAALPAGRRVDRLRPRHRPHGRVRDARLRGLPPGPLRTPGPGHPRAQLEPQGIGFALLIAPAYALGGAQGGRAVPGRDRGARLRARRAGGAADRARAVGERRGAAGRPLAARARARDRRLPRGRWPGRRSPARRCARCACASGPRHRQRGRRRGAARRAAVAGAEVPAAGGAGRGRARALDGAPRPPHGRARGGRDHGRLDRRLRDDQRPPVRRPDALRRVGVGRQPDRRGLGRATTSSGCRGWPALWIDRDVGLLRWAPVLALSVFAAWLLWRSRRAHLARLVAERARRGGRRRARARRLGGRARRRRVRRAVARRRVVRGPPARRRAARSRPRSRLGPAPRARAPAPCSARSRCSCSLWLVLAFAFGGADGWAAGTWTRRSGRGSTCCRGLRVRGSRVDCGWVAAALVAGGGA